VPKAKREYGYYVLPLLVGDRIVGRAEPRLDRKTRTLELLGAWGDTARLGEALEELAAFVGAERVASAPSGNAAPLLGRQHQARGRTRARQGIAAWRV
jgi:uncharacterized protein YcaQ